MSIGIWDSRRAAVGSQNVVGGTLSHHAEHPEKEHEARGSGPSPAASSRLSLPVASCRFAWEPGHCSSKTSRCYFRARLLLASAFKLQERGRAPPAARVLVAQAGEKR